MISSGFKKRSFFLTFRWKKKSNGATLIRLWAFPNCTTALRALRLAVFSKFSLLSSYWGTTPIGQRGATLYGHINVSVESFMELSFRNVGWPFHIGKVWEFQQYCVWQSGSSSYSLVQWIFDASLCQGDLFSLVFSLLPDSFAMMMLANYNFLCSKIVNPNCYSTFHIPWIVDFLTPPKKDISIFQSKLTLEKASQLDWKHFPSPSGHIPARARTRTVIWPTFLPLPIGAEVKIPPLLLHEIAFRLRRRHTWR